MKSLLHQFISKPNNIILYLTLLTFLLEIALWYSINLLIFDRLNREIKRVAQSKSRSLLFRPRVSFWKNNGPRRPLKDDFKSKITNTHLPNEETCWEIRYNHSGIFFFAKKKRLLRIQLTEGIIKPNEVDPQSTQRNVRITLRN